MHTIRAGGAPISWGVCEIPGWGPQLPYARVLDELREAGYAGTELGPPGFFPTDPDRLAAELERRGLALAAAFVPLPFRDPHRFDESKAGIRETAALLRRLNARHILLADAGDADRARIAGRLMRTRGHGLRPGEWRGYLDRVQHLARLCAEEYGLAPSFHPHAGTYIENPEEIAALMEGTDPGVLRLCLDTGHAAFGGGDPVLLSRTYRDRLGHLHLKDIDLSRLKSLLESRDTYAGIARQDVFVELGRGSLDLRRLLDTIRASGYAGWVIVEQDRVADPERDTLGSARRNRDYIRAHLGV